ncbi:allantoate amidohydrolase [Chitinophaga pinensis]|uniref:Amidase, hydantoinase/carbamoylase family n=1 Tax=Chitinophaga pinensis (strain ATCC 43595 / DSM 2588 / LMG 13176 / NBRC 15968 / NCIMB 11800 / UQM 2034) TaxID=485918 RepID=A0A979GBD2_CHIPD|nr:allantoate amidohydrolase [Chitinophaga pinensis]ACU64171.1 amidase, hydantoinase/carbamoylase family [Chitinophaga pinensis DSM 2588]
MENYLHRANSILARIHELAGISEDTTCITRTFGSPAFISGCSKVLSWMQEAGLTARIDNIGNVRGRWNSQEPNARTLVIASHIDTVRNAGRFDGPLGVIMGIDLIHYLQQEKIQLPFNIELIAFSDEEGVRFHTAYLGSTTVAGSFDIELLNKTDSDGITLRDAIKTIGGDPALLSDDAIPREEWLGYFEIHIEQGPVLYEEKLPVAVVQTIAGQQRIRVKFNGVSGHAGTVPMEMRHDALCATAEFILAAEHYASTQKEALLATIGTLHITDQASNVIPGEVTCTLDLRSSDAMILKKARRSLKDIASQICHERRLTADWDLIQKHKPVECDTALSHLLAQAVTAAGYDLKNLHSGAGHDAVTISTVAPVCMLFVRCYKGISHQPQENVEVPDIAAAVKVSDHFIHRLTEVYKKR